MLVGMITQGIAVVRSHALYAFSQPGPPNPLSFWDILDFRLFSSVLTSQTIAYHLPSAFPFVIAVGLGIIFLMSMQDPRRLWRNLVIISVMLGLLLPVYLRFNNNIGLLSITANGDRYFYIEKVLIVWFLALNLIRTEIVAILFFTVVLTSIQNFKMPPLKDLNWPKYAHDLMDGHSVDIPINGGGEIWMVHVDPHRSKQ